MYSEDDLLPLSALQHLLFCERQCALIHIEGVWMENRLTAEGRVLHERVHNPGAERRHRVRVEFSLALRSLRLGLAGQADVVEFHASGGDEERQERADGAGKARELPYPVEYKRGKPKQDRSDLVQLCAQAMCLEEMVGVDVPEGALFYGRERRRTKVLFSEDLREDTRNAARRLHELVASGITPPPDYGKKCRACSLRDACLPRPCSGGSPVARYMAEVMDDAIGNAREEGS